MHRNLIKPASRRQGLLPRPQKAFAERYLVTMILIYLHQKTGKHGGTTMRRLNKQSPPQEVTALTVNCNVQFLECKLHLPRKKKPVPEMLGLFQTCIAI